MMQPNKMQIMNDMMRNLRRGDGISNLQALQQMKQIRQPQPQTMTYMAKGGFPDLSGDGKITQKDILMGRGVIEKRYGGLTGLPVQNMFLGGITKKIGKGVRTLGGAASDAFKGITSGISSALGGGEGTSNFLKNLAIQLALTAVMGPASQFANPYARAAFRFGKGYLGSALQGGIPGLTKNLADPGKLTSGAVAASLGAIGDQFAADATPTSEIETSDKMFSPSPDPTAMQYNEAGKAIGTPTYEGMDKMLPSSEIGVADASGEVPIGDFPRDKILGSKDLAKAVDYVKGIPETTTGVDSFTPFAADFGDAPITYGDVGKAGIAAYGEMEKKKQFDMAKKMEQDARGSAEALTNRMEAEQRSAAEFARLAMEDPVLYNYVYKYADNPEAVVDIVKRMTMGADDLQTAQMFEPATYTTESGRLPGELTAAYGGGISSIVKNALGQNKQFASGMVPDTVDPKSDGMSDSETMIITDEEGKEPKGIMKISEEEYVISAPDMAILGNGSARAGAKKLDNFRKGLRQMAYGTSTHQPRINSNKALQSLMRG